MTHALNRTWIHAVWSTKHRNPVITAAIEPQVYAYIRNQFVKMGCSIKIINGMPDHVHVLFLLNRTKDIAAVLKQVKGSSSRFINKHGLTPTRFSWQTGYGTFSVNGYQVTRVHAYIKNQKQHHLTLTYAQEYRELVREFGLEL